MKYYKALSIALKYADLLIKYMPIIAETIERIEKSITNRTIKRENLMHICTVILARLGIKIIE